MNVVEALGEVAEDELRVGALGEDVEEIRRRNKVEARKRDALRLEVIL